MSDWQNFVRKVWRVDNIPILTALAAGIAGLVAPAFVEMTIGRAVAIIMGVLVGIVLSLGLDRIWRLANIENHLRKLAEPGADAVLRERQDLGFLMHESEKTGRAAHDILATGITLRYLAEATNDLERLLKRGTQVRLMIRKFDASAIAALAESLDEPEDVIKMNRDSAVQKFESLAKRATDEKYPGRLRLRELRSTPRVAAMIVDGDQPWGKMQIELLPFRIPVNERPTFRLAKADSNDEWFDRFRKSCENAWEVGQPLIES